MNRKRRASPNNNPIQLGNEPNAVPPIAASNMPFGNIRFSASEVKLLPQPEQVRTDSPRKLATLEPSGIVPPHFGQLRGYFISVTIQTPNDAVEK
jgi:hypothetical protein